MPTGVPYPIEMRLRAIEIYSRGHTISNTCLLIDKEFTSMPSYFAVRRWVMIAGVHRNDHQKIKPYTRQGKVRRYLALISGTGVPRPKLLALAKQFNMHYQNICVLEEYKEFKT